MKYSLIAKEYSEELDRKEPFIKHTMITWGDCQLMEDLFELFGGDRVKLRERIGCIKDGLGINFDGENMRITFVNGKQMEIWISEWGGIRVPEIGR